MRELSVWAMETEIMTTAKMFRRDICMWFDNKWLHYSYLREPSKDAIYRQGRHFNVILQP